MEEGSGRARRGARGWCRGCGRVWAGGRSDSDDRDGRGEAGKGRHAESSAGCPGHRQWDNDTPADTAALVARSFDVWLPKGWVYNGAKHPICRLAKLNAGGPSKCPPGSIMGGPSGGVGDPNDLSPPPRVTVINGGPSKMYFWVVLLHTARVQMAIPGAITKVNSPRWSYRLHADNPARLQLVSGIPITLDSFRASFGRGDWIVTTSCPRDQRWRYRLRMTSTSGQVLDADGSVPCRS